MCGSERVGFGVVVRMVRVSFWPIAGSFLFDVDLFVRRGPKGIGAGVEVDVVPVVVYEFNRFWSGSLIEVVTSSKGGIDPKGFSF
jgi:hypothetical protein